MAWKKKDGTIIPTLEDVREYDKKLVEVQRREQVEGMTLEEKVDFLINLWVRQEL